MKRNNRFISKLLIILLAISFSVGTVIILSKIIFEKMQNEQEMMSNYYTKKEKCEFLKAIAKESIKEGVGIDTRKIPNDKVKYRMYNNSKGIVFYYYLQDNLTTEHDRYNATIILSNDYRILEEKYSIEIESLDEYIKSYNFENRVVSVMFGMITFGILYYLIYILVITISLCYRKRYLIYKWRESYLIFKGRGGIALLTAEELYKRVIEDSISDYNWVASARELVRICKKASFPRHYALDIEIAILSCFASIEERTQCCGNLYPKDKEAVQYCYNSLYNYKDEQAIRARKRYLAAMIDSASYVHLEDDWIYHLSHTFKKLRENWRQSKFVKYISQEKIDFEQLIKVLHNDFAEMVRKAESNGEHVVQVKIRPNRNFKRMK